MLYLDNSATTKVHPEVLEAMLPYLQEEYGNPSSKYYTLAENAKRAVNIARDQVAQLVGCDSDEVIFTSGATESNNMVIKGVSDYYSNHSPLIFATTKVEHPSVYECYHYLELRGNKVIWLDSDQYGRIDPSSLNKILLDHRPLLTSIIWG